MSDAKKRTSKPRVQKGRVQASFLSIPTDFIEGMDDKRILSAVVAAAMSAWLDDPSGSPGLTSAVKRFISHREIEDEFFPDDLVGRLQKLRNATQNQRAKRGRGEVAPL